MVATYRATPTLENWRRISRAFGPLQGRIIGRWSCVLGGQEDAQQTLQLALLWAVARLDVTTTAFIALEIAHDVWDFLEGEGILRDAAKGALTVELEEDPRAEEATQELHAEDPLARLNAAVPTIITTETRDMLLLKHMRGMNAREIADLYGLPHENVRKNLNNAEKRLAEGVKGRPHGRKPR
jgi:DNA-directed RNA polymerase specialized sigma24 family protein